MDKKQLLPIVGMVMWAAAAHAADKPHLLTPDEIKTTFATGTAFSATAPSGKVVMFTFKADGSALSAAKGQKKGTKGKWRVSDTGYCTTWGKNAEHCYTVRQTGTSYEVLNQSGTIVAHWAP